MNRRKVIVLVLSLANLCLIPVWNRLLYPSAKFSMDYSPATIEYAGALLNLALLVIIFLLLANVSHIHSKTHVASKAALWGVFGIVLLMPLNWLRLQAAIRFQQLSLKGILNHIGEIAGIICISLALMLITVIMLRWQNRMLRFFTSLVLILSPFCLLTIGQAIFKILENKPVTRFPDRLPARLIDSSALNKARVLIVIFDEMDQSLAFDMRSDDLRLPEFDRFRREAFYASNAFPPAMNTIASMPALTTGRLVRNVWPLNQQELLLDYEGSSKMLSWSGQPNIFSAAYNLGFNTALVGRAIPYSRIIGGNLTSYLLPDSGQNTNVPVTLFAAMRGQLMSVIGTLPFATRLDFRGKLMSRTEKEADLRRAIELHKSNLENSKKVAIDLKYGLALVHYDVPHQPWLYNRVQGEYSRAGDGNYLDNLSLADRTLGSLRREMETADVWNSTNVLITSDHWLRSNGTDRRVPFMLKLAGQNDAVQFDKPFNTILVYDLVNALLSQSLMSYPALVSWFNTHSTIGPSPYY